MFANRRAEQLLGYEREELPLVPVSRTTAEQEASADVLARLLRGEVVPPYERIMRRKDGALIPVEINVQLVRDDRGVPICIQSIVRDISERKAAEERIADLAATRERLLREVYHRTRNNLHLLRSIVMIERDHVADPTAREVLDAVDARIGSIETVHASLQTGDVTGIIAVDTYLHHLIDQIQRSISGAVALSFSGTPCHMDADVATPLGIIVNELITNAIKHAFRAADAPAAAVDPRIEVTLRCPEPDAGADAPTPHGCAEFELTVADNGTGHRGAPVRSDGTGLGALLTDGLARQIGAVLAYTGRPGGGTVVTVRCDDASRR